MSDPYYEQVIDCYQVYDSETRRTYINRDHTEWVQHDPIKPGTIKEEWWPIVLLLLKEDA